MALLSFLPLFHFPFFHFSFFNLFCFSSLYQVHVVVLLTVLETKVNCLLFSQRKEREREREREREPSRDGVGRLVRWCWANFPTNLDTSSKGCLDIFSLVYLFSFLFPSLGDGPI